MHGRDENYLSGTPFNDRMVGGRGRDLFSGLSGDDILDGRGGDDELWGGIGNDTLLGGRGNDHLEDTDGANYMVGGLGNDTLVGNGVLYGGAGNDSLCLYNGNGNASGGRGDDSILAHFTPGSGAFLHGADSADFFHIQPTDRFGQGGQSQGGYAWMNDFRSGEDTLFIETNLPSDGSGPVYENWGAKLDTNLDGIINGTDPGGLAVALVDHTGTPGLYLTIGDDHVWMHSTETMVVADFVWPPWVG